MTPFVQQTARATEAAQAAYNQQTNSNNSNHYRHKTINAERKKIIKFSVIKLYHVFRE
jgi:hypothetical protein